MADLPPASHADPSPSGAPDDASSVRAVAGDDHFARVAATFERLRCLRADRRHAELARLRASEPGLADEVADLLRHHEQSDTLLDAPLIRPGVPSRIGVYRLVRLLGEGGMGTVWLAEQAEPVRREVALKLIKLGMDTRQVIRRFEAERQVLARMEHPGIARVLDAGVASDGRPYFAMELVRGELVTAYCDRRRLSVADRLRLFQKVCAAVQHAHGKGVIHRDLKPSNILVTEIDGAPVPKVIDFGVAKVLDDRQGDRTNWTAVGQAIGTPDYMSPEQAGIRVAGTRDGHHQIADAPDADIDIRSDVWSLGVVLFELLTGTTPTKARSRTGSGSGTPRTDFAISPGTGVPRPSSVVAPRRSTTATHDQRELARRRGSDPTALRRLLRSELDWIVLRALEHEPARRYGTVAALADDVGRFLENRPIAARPSAALYEARKFARRHLVAIAASALVLLSLLVGLATALYGLNQARQDRDLAVAAEQSEAALAGRLRNELATNMIERGRLAGYADNVALASSLLWDAYLHRPDSVHSHWALRELMMRHPVRMSVGYPGRTPFDAAMMGADELLVVGSGLQPIVLDADSGAVRRVLDGGIGEMRSVDLSPDGTLAITGEREGFVRLWALDGALEQATLLSVTTGLVVARFLDDAHVVAGDADGTIHVIPIADTARTVRIETGIGAIEQLEVHRPTGRIAVGTRAGAMLLLEDAEATPRHLEGHRGIVMALRFSPDGTQLASGGNDRVVHLWNAEDGSPGATLDPRNGSIRDLRYTADGRELLVLGWWRLDSYDLATLSSRELIAEGGWRLTPHPDAGRMTIVGRNRNHIRSWQLDARALVARRQLPADWTVRLMHAACGSATVGFAGATASGLDESGEPRWQVDLGETRVTAVAVSPEGGRVAVGGSDGTVRIADLAPTTVASASTFREPVAHSVIEGCVPSPNRALAFVDNDTLIVPTEANELIEIDLRSGRRRPLVADSSAVMHPAVDEHEHANSPAARRAGGFDPSREVLIVAVSPDRSMIGVTQRAGLVHVIDRASGELRTTELETTNFSLVFTHDGRSLITGGWTGIVSIFDVRTLERRRSQQHSALVTQLAMHPHDPDLFASVSSDGSVRIWSVAEFRNIFWLAPLGNTPLVAVGFDGEGAEVSAVGLGGAVANWPIALADPFIEGNIEFERQERQRTELHAVTDS